MASWGEDWGEDWGGSTPVITDHKNAGLARLISQFQKPNIEKVVCNFGIRTQDIESLAANVAELFNIDVADDIYQDILGSILGQPRNAFNNTDYRVFLRTRSQIVKRRTTVEDLLTMLRRLVNDGARNISYFDQFPKGYKVEVASLTPAEIAAFIPFVRLAKPATYIGKFIVTPTDAFGFSDVTLAIPTTNFGFGDATGALPLIGGPLAYVVPF